MKDLEPSVKKGLMFLRHELEDLRNNLIGQDYSEDGLLLRSEHTFNREKLGYWIEHIRGLEQKVKQ